MNVLKARMAICTGGQNSTQSGGGGDASVGNCGYGTWYLFIISDCL